MVLLLPAMPQAIGGNSNPQPVAHPLSPANAALPLATNPVFDLSDRTVSLGLVVPDEIIIRFWTTEAAALHAHRMVVAPSQPGDWVNNAITAGLPPLPSEIVGLRPYVSGEAKVMRTLRAQPQFVAIAAAVDAGQPLQADKVAAVANAIAAAAEPFDSINMFYAKLAEGTDLRDMCLTLVKRSDVEFANPSPIYEPVGVPDDQLYSRQWNLTRINMPAAWDTSGNTYDPGGVRVCVVDTGVRVTHSELSGRTAAHKDVYLDNGDAYGDSDPDNDDPDGHGTACAGIIASKRDNSSLVAGIAPVTIIPVNGAGSVWNPDTQEWEWLIYNYADGVRWCVDHDASVINLSLGGYRTTPYPEEISAANYADSHNVLVMAAAGNANNEGTSEYGVPQTADNHYPSAISTYMSVAAVDDDDIRVRKDKWWWGSNYGNTVDICAPGQGNVGTHSDSILTLGNADNSDDINTFNGTSAATPHVAGLAALLKYVNNTLTATEIRSIIETTAIDQVGDPAEDTPGWDQYHGHGLIDAAVAVSTAQRNPVSVTDPSPWFTKGSNSGHPEYWIDGSHDDHPYLLTYIGGMSGDPWEPDCWAEFKPYLSQSGEYDVYTYFYADPSECSHVPYTWTLDK